MNFDESEINCVSPPRRRALFNVAINDTSIFSISALIVVGTLAFNRYVLPPEWATSLNGLHFVDAVARLYPGLSELKRNWGGYTPQLGVLFSSMWLGMPFHFLLGVTSSCFLKADQYKDCVCNAPWRDFLPFFSLVVLSAWIPFFLSHVDGHGRRMPFTNQASTNFIVAAYSWILMISIIYTFGRQLGLLSQKLTYWARNSPSNS